jgi:hypothetical protein
MKANACTRSCGDRRDFIGGSDARIIMGQDEKALIRLWQEKRGEVGPAPTCGSAGMAVGRAPYLLPGFFGTRLRSLTPGPSPFSSMKTMPASSSARRIARSFGDVSEVLSSVSSARRIVAMPTADSRARSSARHRRRARAALIWALVSALSLDFI